MFDKLYYLVINQSPPLALTHSLTLLHAHSHRVGDLLLFRHCTKVDGSPGGGGGGPAAATARGASFIRLHGHGQRALKHEIIVRFKQHRDKPTSSTTIR